MAQRDIEAQVTSVLSPEVPETIRGIENVPETALRG